MKYSVVQWSCKTFMNKQLYYCTSLKSRDEMYVRLQISVTTVV